MSADMTENTSCCSDESCGCRLDVYPTDRKCPECGMRLRLSGHAQNLELRLTCQNCGYASRMLSQEEIGELL